MTLRTRTCVPHSHALHFERVHMGSRIRGKYFLKPVPWSFIRPTAFLYAPGIPKNHYNILWNNSQHIESTWTFNYYLRIVNVHLELKSTADQSYYDTSCSKIYQSPPPIKDRPPIFWWISKNTREIEYTSYPLIFSL